MTEFQPPSVMSPVPGMMNIAATFEQTAKLALFNQVRTGNWLLDSLLISGIVYLIGLVWQILGGLRPWFYFLANPIVLKNAITRVFIYLVRRVIPNSKLAHRYQETQTKVAIVSYVTENKEINELYEPVYAFCNSMIPNETQGMLTWQKVKQKHTDATANVPRDRTCTFKWGEHEFTYQHSSPKITIHADRERQRENYTVTLSVTVKKGSQDPFPSLFAEASAAWQRLQSKLSWVQTVYRNVDDKWVATNARAKRRIETVILADGLRDEIAEDFKEFVNSESWYVERDTTYARRYLFYGKPRTGKTSMIKALATYNQRHIHYLQLSTVKDDDQLLRLLDSVDYSKTIVVVEDVDASSKAVLDRRFQNVEVQQKTETPEDEQHPKEQKKELTLSGILNALDGVFHNHGQIMIMTSNYPEKLDVALIGPERIHRKFEFKLADQQQLSDLYFNFFNLTADKDLVSLFVDGVISPAQITTEFVMNKRSPENGLRTVVEQSILASKGEFTEHIPKSFIVSNTDATSGVVSGVVEYISK